MGIFMDCRHEESGFSRFVIALLITASGVALLTYASIQASQSQVVNVPELVEQAEQYDGNPVQFSGQVVPGTVEHDQETLELSFTVQPNPQVQPEKVVQNEKHRVRVQYRGDKPDAFREENLAIVEGTYNASEQRVEAYTLQAKCPSKYEEKSGEKGADPGQMEDAPYTPDEPSTHESSPG